MGLAPDAFQLHRVPRNPSKRIHSDWERPGKNGLILFTTGPTLFALKGQRHLTAYYGEK